MTSRPFLIAGHPRSGTTVLNRICNTHPEVASTFEFGAFRHLDRPYPEYREGIRVEWRGRPVLGVGEATPRRRRWRSRWFLARFLLALRARRGSEVRLADVTDSLGRALGVPVVGDKVPAYTFLLDELAPREELRCVVIIRDCRAVVASTLDRVRTGWRGREWTERFDSTRKAALHWARAVESVERNAGRLHVLRFEDLVRDPAATAETLAAFLDVDPRGFDVGIIRPPGREKFRESLDGSDLDTIDSAAGEAMRRWGYES